MIIRDFNTNDQVLIVAEIGNNHEGDVSVAAKLIHQAAEAGVDAVKFQVFRTRLFVNHNDTARYERMSRFELSPEQFADLRDLSKSLGLLFIATPLDIESLHSIGSIVDCLKISSGDVDFYPLIEAAAATGKPMIMSSGASTLTEIRRSVEVVRARWSERRLLQDLGVLHCVSNYPTRPADANLKAILTLKQELDCEVGYSDHTLGISACVLSVALGARVIEKHFTLDKNYSTFRDHQLSADVHEMAELVERVREASILMGSGAKCLLPNDVEAARLIRRSIVAARELSIGDRISRDDFLWLRPADGLAPGEEASLIGKTIIQPIAVGEPITLTKVA